MSSLKKPTETPPLVKRLEVIEECLAQLTQNVGKLLEVVAVQAGLDLDDLPR